MIKAEYIITPLKGFGRLNWRELWLYRDLFLVMAWRDISVRYKQTVLGVLWAILQPVLTMVIFTLIFNRMASIESGDGTPYPIFVFVGQLFWQYFSSTLNNASQSMVANAGLIQKVYFPRLILPATAATTSLVDFCVAAVVLVGLMVYWGFVPKVTGLVVLPVALITTVLCSIGIGLFLAAINVKYRDVRYALPFFINILMFVTPVIYPVSMLDNHPVIKGVMVWLNPMAGGITNARASILGGATVDWGLLWIALGVSVFYFLVGLFFFRRTEGYFADIA